MKKILLICLFFISSIFGNDLYTGLWITEEDKSIVKILKKAMMIVEEDEVNSEEKTEECKIENAANQNYDEMVVWFQLEGGFSLSTAESYAKLLIDSDIATIAKLKRKLEKNENIWFN